MSLSPLIRSVVWSICFIHVFKKTLGLGPVFDEKLQGRWDEHLVKMKSFWRSVLLKTGEYKGQPMPAHVRLKTAVSEDFQIWLGLFRDTAFECFDAEAAPLVIEVAERIAQSFWLGMFGTPFSSPPQWMSSQSLNQVTEC